MCSWWFRLTDYGGITAVALTGGAFYLVFHHKLPPWLTKPTVVFVLVVLLFPLAIGWRAIFPPPLELITSDDEVTYRFTREEYRDAFLSLNLDEESYDETN
jgi:hypothetical protein